MGNLFYNIYERIRSKKMASLVILSLLILALVFTAFRIQFEEDITKLIPSNDKTTEAQNVLKTISFADKIIVNIKRQQNGSVDDLTNYASEFIDSITKHSGTFIKNIQGKVQDDDIQNTLNFIYENLPLFLEESDFDIIQKKLNRDSIQLITANNYKTLISPSGFIAKDQILKDPLGISFLALKKLQQLSFGDDFSLQNGFLLSKDKNHILLFITPTFASSETAKNSEFADILYATNSALNSKYGSKIQSEYFGGALVAVANAQQIKQDIQLTVGIAVTILLLILILFYRKITIPFILFVPTIIGGLVAVVILFFIRTNISAISLGIGSVLLGVTLDYSLHILTHIRNHNSTKALYKDIAKPILMSSLTTALAFLCLLFLDSQALQDLGVFASISVIVSSVFALIFIPQVYKNKAQLIPKRTFIDTTAAISFHKNKWLIGTLIAILIFSCFTYSKVIFDKDITKLNYEPEHLKEAQLRLDALTNTSSKSVYLAAYHSSSEDALKTNDRIYNILEGLKSDGEIIDFSSIGSLIHSNTKQTQRLQKWNSFWTDSLIQNTKTNIIESSKGFGFKPKTFETFFALLNSDFKALNIDAFNALKFITIDDYIVSKDNFSTVTTLVKVSNQKKQQLIQKFESHSNIVVIDRQQMNETFLGHLKTDFNRLVKYSFIVVLIILLLVYRSVSLTLVTLIPIALTWLLTIGLMGFLGIEFNIFNIIISTFIFGLGIDYSIFITNGLLHEYKTGDKALGTHKTSILLSFITTILGVGVLIFAKHPALYTISLVSIIGIVSAVVISFTLQPLLFKLFIGSLTKRPITLRLLLHSILSFGYYGIGGLLLSIISVILIPIIPVSKKIKMSWFHKVLSKFMKSVLYTNPFVEKRIINPHREAFKKQAIIVSNHTSFLDILAIGMLHPKIIFLVNDWVYNSPVFGKAVKLAGFYPVSNGIDNGLSHLQKKIDQGYSLMAFPEGTRSNTNKMKRFHKGAFYLAEQFNLDILPVLIHGNSEVLPKGSFVIKNGSITLKILDRIKANDPNFGTNSREKTKSISAYFKKEFTILRKEIENDTYFHRIVLEDYRYKGDGLYQKVKEDLNSNAKNYKTILDNISDKDITVHISKDAGQLDFLLALHKPSIKLFTYLVDENERSIIRNSYISNTHYKISILGSIEDALLNSPSVAIINSEKLDENQLKIIANTANLFILLKESKTLYLEIITQLGFQIEMTNKTLTLLKK